MRERLVDDMLVGGSSVVVLAPIIVVHSCYADLRTQKFVLTARVILKHC